MQGLQVTMLGEERLGPVGTGVGVVLARLQPAQGVFGLVCTLIALRQHLLEVKLESLDTRYSANVLMWAQTGEGILSVSQLGLS